MPILQEEGKTMAGLVTLRKDLGREWKEPPHYLTTKKSKQQMKFRKLLLSKLLSTHFKIDEAQLKMTK